MDPIRIIEKHYKPNSSAHRILIHHSRKVAERAVAVAENVPHLNLDLAFLYEAAMLHDIGIIQTNSPSLGCFGTQPYVCHGYLGRMMLEVEGLPRHALVCERHVGTGITRNEIRARQLPLPLREMVAVSVEEQIVCFADKFFSKNGKGCIQPHSVETVIRQLSRYGGESVEKFLRWVDLFGTV